MSQNVKSQYQTDGRFAIVPVALLKDPESNPNIITVYTVIRSFADFGNGSQKAAVGDTKIAAVAGCSERTVWAARKWLVEHGWLEQERRGKKLVNRYIVHSVIRTTRESQQVTRTTCESEPQDVRVHRSKSHVPRENPKIVAGEHAGTGDKSVESLHQHFNSQRNGRDLKLTKDRRAKYRARLRTYTPDELRTAISNALRDPFFRGENDRSTRYDYPEIVLKNDAAVDRHLEPVQSNGRKPYRATGVPAGDAGPDSETSARLRQMFEDDP